MNYEERIICFIDLLGFKAAINQSIDDAGIRDTLYKIISEQLHKDPLLDFMHDQLPTYILDKPPVRGQLLDLSNRVPRNQSKLNHPVTVTQFSDSFVLSCPENNLKSCQILIHSAYLIHLAFFFNLGMLMRGGMTIGKLIHEETGTLFGPAMNEAHLLESEKAYVPRVIVSDKAYEHLLSLLGNDAALIPFKKSYDSHFTFDLVGIFTWPKFNRKYMDGVDELFKGIEKDAQQGGPRAVAKIQYISNEWSKLKPTY